MPTYQNPITADVYAINLWTSADGVYQYATWVAFDYGGLYVGQIERGVQTWGVDHDEFLILPGTTAGDELMPDGSWDTDSHNFPSIFTDALDRVWVLGNMHNNQSGSANGLAMIRSTNPNDISSWTVPSNPLPSIDANITYPIAVALADGSVMVTLRDSPATHGGTGIGNWSYWIINSSGVVGSRNLWMRGVPTSGLGSETNSADDENQYNFSPYITVPFVEHPGGRNPGRIHVGLIWRQYDTGGDGSSQEIDRTNHYLSYIYSDDNAATWQSIDGRTLTLPLVPWADQGEQTGLECPYGQTVAPGYLNFGSLAVDKRGHPHMVISNQPKYRVWWDGSWHQSALDQTPGALLVHSIGTAIWFQDSLWYMASASLDSGTTRFPYLVNADTSAFYKIGGRVDSDAGWEFGFDRKAFELFGSIEVLTPQQNSPEVYTFGNHAALAA